MPAVAERPVDNPAGARPELLQRLGQDRQVIAHRRPPGDRAAVPQDGAIGPKRITPRSAGRGGVIEESGRG